MKFTNKDGVSRYGRYTIVPEAGEEHLDAATAAAKGPNYLFNELNERLAKGCSGAVSLQKGCPAIKPARFPQC